MWIKPVLLVFCLGFLAGCVSPSDTQASQQTLNQSIIANKILHVQSGEFIDEADLIKHMLDSDYLLLGETHDNRHHHDHQVHVIDLLRQQQQSVSVSFEMITYQQGEMLKQHAYSTPSDLIEILDHSKNNWPYKRDYQRVFASVMAAGYEILPANLDVNRLIKISIQGDDELPEDVRQILNKAPLTTKHRTDLLNEIVLAHCNKLPLEVTRPMVEVQWMRDAVMSLSLLNSNADIKVLIAGAGHTRNDRGVPLYLRNHDKQSSILSVAFLDIEQDATSIDAYAQRWGGQALPFDYVWFTPAVQRQQDPCDTIEHRKRQKRPKDDRTKETGI
jgi:uncharacterized iron-regulated protein